MAKREVRAAQSDIIDYIVESLSSPRRACGVWAGMGLGKTGSTLIALETLSILGEEVYPALVVAPIRVAQNTWPSEVEKWPDHLSDVTVSVAIGTPAQRVAALQRPAKIYTINYDNLSWLRKYYDGEPFPFKTIIADESTRLAGLRASVQTQTGGKPVKPFIAGQGSVQAMNLLRLSWAYKTFFIELTGTPATKGLEKLWGQLFFMDYGKRLGRTFSAFEGRWFAIRKNESNYVQRVPFAHSDAEITRAVADICRAFDAKDYYDVREPIVRQIWVDLPPKAREQYNEMERTFYTKIEGHEVEAFNAGTKSGKLSQLANGAAYVGDADDIDDDSGERPWVTVHDEKLDALESIVEEANGMPVMVVYWFKSDLARLRKRFPRGRVLDKKKSTEDRWNAGEIPLLFVHYQSAGHGVNLQDGGNICAIFGMTWSLDLYLQVIERIGPMRQLQSGYDRAVFVYQILARNTIDEDMLDRMNTNKSILDALREGVKRRIGR